MSVAILGLGEAGSHFANDLINLDVVVFGFDPALKRYVHPKVQLMRSNAEAARHADLIFSVNVATVAEEVAAEVSTVAHKGQVYAEMNTASPQQKRGVAKILAHTGALVADVAIMAPVPPKGLKTPFLTSGPGALKFLELLKPYHSDTTVLNETVGDAATHKLLRSIVYKGFAAVIGEAITASQAMGLEKYMREQIASLIDGNDALIDRFIEGSKMHALRRSHELEAVVEMLKDNRVDPVMSRATLKSLQNLIEK